MFSAARRQDQIDQLNRQSFDVVIIGGGITGAGIALDAISRGLSVAIIDMQDFAGGTSSRSTKLVHGGLRYLKQAQVGIVAEVGRERKIVYENGVHITTPLGMLLPFYKGGQFGPTTTSIGLKVYDSLAGVKKSERRVMLSPEETLQKEPLLKKDGLRGGGLYVEYRTDDARLTIEVLKRAVELGAVALNYVKALSFIYDDNKKVAGIYAIDQITKREITIRGKAVVNAAGPWVNEVMERDPLASSKKALLRTKGVHIVIDQSIFPLKQSVYFDTEDGRMIFAIPREGKAYVGTTDTIYHDDPVEPVATSEDVAYILDAVHYIFPDVDVSFKDVESTWSGVRPLIYEKGKDPSEVSRKDEVWESESGLLTMAGGKLTGYRRMAEEVVDRLAKRKEFRGTGPCVTKELSLSGATMLTPENFDAYVAFKGDEGVQYGLTKKVAEELVHKYGTNIEDIYRILRVTKNDYKDRGLPVDLYLEVIYGMQFEMAYTLADVFIRRTGKLYFDIQQVRKYKDEVISLMSDYLEYTDHEKALHQQELEQLLEDATHFAKEGSHG